MHNRISPAQIVVPDYETPPDGPSTSEQADFASMNTASTSAGASTERIQMSSAEGQDMDQAEECPDSHLGAYWSMLERKLDSDNPRKNTLRLLQKYLWVVIISLAAIETFGAIKAPLLELKTLKMANSKIVAEKVESKIVEAGLRLMQLRLVIQFMKLLLQDRGKILRMLNIIKEFEIKSICFKNLPVALFVSSVALSVLFTSIGFEVIFLNAEWRFQDLAWFQFERIYNSFVIWNPKTNASSIQSIPDLVFYPMAILGFITKFGSFISTYVWQDMFLIIACLLAKNMDYLTELIDSYDHPIENRPPTQVQINERAAKIYNSYQQLKAASKAIHDVFGSILELMHSNYLFVIVLLLYQIFKQFEPGSFIAYGVGFIKSYITYSSCVSVSKKAGKFREWVYQEKVRNTLELGQDNLFVLINEMEHSPIGIGRGENYVNEEFISNMVTKAILYFIVFYKVS